MYINKVYIYFRSICQMNYCFGLVRARYVCFPFKQHQHVPVTNTKLHFDKSNRKFFMLAKFH